MELTRELEINDHTKVVFDLKTRREAGIIDQGLANILTIKYAE